MGPANADDSLVIEADLDIAGRPADALQLTFVRVAHREEGRAGRFGQPVMLDDPGVRKQFPKRLFLGACHVLAADFHPFQPWTGFAEQLRLRQH